MSFRAILFMSYLIQFTAIKCNTQKKPVKILAAVRISYASGRNILSGTFKFLEEHGNWQLHLIQYDREFLPETVLAATEKGFDGIIATFRATMGVHTAIVGNAIVAAPRKNADRTFSAFISFLLSL